METGDRARARGQVDIALCCLMFDGLLRRSEAAVLTWNDIARAADGSGRLTVRRSKTDPEGAGKVLWISPDTMEALDAIRGESDGDTDPVFGLSGQQISRRIAAACETAGLGRGFSGHSLRVGAAQALAGANISLAAIMENGRWQSSPCDLPPIFVPPVILVRQARGQGRLRRGANLVTLQLSSTRGSNHGGWAFAFRAEAADGTLLVPQVR